MSDEAKSSTPADPVMAGGLDGSSSTLDAAAAAVEAGPSDMPYVHTSLTERFQGKFQRLSFPTFEQMMAEDAMNNCGVRSIIAGAGGALLGVAFGVFTASLDTGGMDAAVVGETKSTRVVLRETLQLMKSKSVSYAKGFAVMGLVYSGCECLIEKRRARHDKWNAPLAGCAAGGIMAAPAGPKAMCFGCASFAAFSYAIDRFMGLH
ncbi:import inner membrane translocase subunit Tim22 [Monoraphidium neglectum]|uniref:Import inner membrane translocase subunit Tim22 n=1 Tax=Monoraphidium neglectum TaxID=145388 RepID=A0A0D2J9E8_9CHLO|nr:import inner membrane translocase subunit Tim22 [Monoraphidium neglectum]KIY96372.1 import inner membrane translocase subunit Tim22 [Monoraphidium neglectum]|eukprot:XP_013895392.1 import inner membrane translocase subunit Tim22 [Monoraphidium neglectum]